MELKPWHPFEINGSSATVPGIWDMKGMNGGAGSEEGGISQPWDKHQLFPIAVFLAEGKDGLAYWEQFFLMLCFLVLFPCAGRGAGGPYPENMPWDWLVFLCFSGR